MAENTFADQLVMLHCMDRKYSAGSNVLHLTSAVMQVFLVGCTTCCHATWSKTAAGGAIYSVCTIHTCPACCMHYIGKDWEPCQDMTVLSLTGPQAL